MSFSLYKTKEKTTTLPIRTKAPLLFSKGEKTGCEMD